MTKIIITVVVLLLVLVGFAYYLSVGNTPADSAQNVQNSYATTSPTQQVSQAGASPQSTTTSSAATTNANAKIMTATLHTNHGDIQIEFYPQNAPNAVANFEKLAQSGFYNGTKFHRVIKGFMIQGGDPLTKDDSKMVSWGTGGPGYTFPDEISAHNSNTAGAVAMANSGPNTNGSQFFINAVDNHSLDSGYVVFGQVTAGMNIVSAINQVPTDSSDRPLEPVILQSVTLK